MRTGLTSSRLSELKESLLNSYKSKFFLKGETLFIEGTPVKGLIFIYAGKVKIYKKGPDGAEEILRIARKGDFLGYSKLVKDSRFGASAEVLEDTLIIFIPKKEFLDVLS